MKTVFPLAAALLVGASVQAQTTIAQWTFETSVPGGAGVTASSIGGILPEVGSGTGSGVHASSATVWNNPVGNGSLESFSANNWAIGDYFQFQTSALGYEDIMVKWDQTRSSTGSSNFVFAYSTDGVNFANALTDYFVQAISWSSLTYNPTSSFSADLSGVTALNDAPAVYFRIVANIPPGGSAGTVRTDNFEVIGTLIPEPAGLLAPGGLALVVLNFWRRRRTTM